MGEGYIQKFVRSMRAQLILFTLLFIMLTAALQWSLATFTSLSDLLSTIITAGVVILIGSIGARVLADKLSKPIEYLAQAILHIAPGEHLVAAPNLDTLGFGHELVDSLTRQVYDFASIAGASQPSQAAVSANFMDQIPAGIIGLNEEMVITLANSEATKLTNGQAMVGQKLSDLITINNSDVSLEDWYSQAKQSALKDHKLWQKIQVDSKRGETLGYFDIAASFNNHSASGIDTVLVFADHSQAYQDENAQISFVAMAVHEMRTPVTIMRGYIEAFEDELGPNVSAQLKDDLTKMNVSATGLSSFVSNILNVTRINEGKLQLKLEQQSWNTLLPQLVDGLRIKASAYDKTIELRMQPDMPGAAIDHVTIAEVVTNLVDNAIKYTPNDKQQTIAITSQLNSDGLIETTVSDNGVGIPSSVMANLFSKFQRNQRNQAQISGTGLGLFLCKSIVNAHHGNIWANSKEGEGSQFSFTLLPYDQLASELQTNDNEGIMRGSHGWIKNHSMQRR